MGQRRGAGPGSLCPGCAEPAPARRLVERDAQALSITVGTRWGELLGDTEPCCPRKLSAMPGVFCNQPPAARGCCALKHWGLESVRQELKLQLHWIFIHLHLKFSSHLWLVDCQVG